MRAALADRLQTSMNLALGSALASIGLTIPVVVALDAARHAAGARAWRQRHGAARLDFLVVAIALGTGRTNMMQGAVQLVIFAAFLFLALVP